MTVEADSPRKGPGCMSRGMDRAHNWLDTKMENRGMKYRQRLLAFHFLDQLKEQILAVLPISLLLVFVIGVFFQQTTTNPGQQAYGLVCAIFGLLFFMDGLRVCVMPLGEMVGSRLPLKYPLPVVLLVAGCLGILVTYAEPAIASLSPLAQLVDKTRAPYLYYALNDQQEMLVLSIGLGVGLAAVVGTLRFVRGWSLKPIIYISLVPTIALACYMQWGNPDLAPLLGLAWDCGAVTTGPVTVPILLAMGIGVMKSQRQKRLARAALHNAVDTNTGQTLEGFGVVTLASLFPVLAVEIMGIMISVTVTKEDIINTANDSISTAAVDQSPLREVVFAIRAIMPLIVALLLLVILVIREPLPPITVYTVPPAVNGPDDEPGGSLGKSATLASASASVCGALAADSSPLTDSLGAPSTGFGVAVAITSGPEQPKGKAVCEALEEPTSGAAASPGPDGKAAEEQPPLGADGQGAQGQAAAAAAAVEAGVTAGKAASGSDSGGGGDGGSGCSDVNNKEGVEEVASVVLVVNSEVPPPPREPWYMRYGGLICGILMAQGGMIMFNIGLTYGFTALGNQAGTLLPAAYLQVPAFPDSPYYSYVGGIVLVMVVVIALGFLATRAEPALRVLGQTVQHLSSGTFTAAMLIYAVSVGVGLGMAVGSTKILFGVPLIYIILVKYAIAVSITVFSEESFTNIAWDSAGVTTGPVTVPFVLSLGIGFSKATGATEGFGILTAASVAPIISVLLTNLLKKPARTALRQLSRLSTRSRGGAGAPSRSYLTVLSKRAKRHKDTNEAISSVAAIAAAAARLENQTLGGASTSNYSSGGSRSFGDSLRPQDFAVPVSGYGPEVPSNMEEEPGPPQAP